MATAPREQRIYRAACPGCGAPVEFRSAQSTHAICSYCRSMVVRSGDVLSRLGTIAEVLDDHTPLQLMAAGRYADRPFTLIGRLQYKSTTGIWTEWNAFFDDGTTAILGEDNGSYVFSAPWALPGGNAPDPLQLRVGSSVTIAGRSFSVASNDSVALISAQGELPKLPPVGVSFPSVELRSDRGEVLSLEYVSGVPTSMLGVAVQLADLRLTGLRDESVSEDKGARAFSCPNCGAPVELRLDTTKSITCNNCHSIIDVAGGIGGELRHAEQDQPVRPLIALGTAGSFQGNDWQVVGFQQRSGQAPGDSEVFGWSEYLLFNRTLGFTFLVDSDDGWSFVKPLTGAPSLARGGATASYLGRTYKLDFTYTAVTTYVAGEFYWPVQKGQRTANRDYSSGSTILASEKTPSEETWSGGDKVDSSVVGASFGLANRIESGQRGDVAPLATKKGLGCGMIILIIIVLIILLLILSTCSSSGGSGSGSRSSGGSFGGSSSGGGHK